MHRYLIYKMIVLERILAWIHDGTTVVKPGVGMTMLEG